MGAMHPEREKVQRYVDTQGTRFNRRTLAQGGPDRPQILSHNHHEIFSEILGQAGRQQENGSYKGHHKRPERKGQGSLVEISEK